MPSIIIREKDNTTSPTPEYANFSVVIPGNYDTSKTELPFDDNGIYECDDQAEFEEKIGLCKSINDEKAAAYAKPTAKETAGTVGTDFEKKYAYHCDDGSGSSDIMSEEDFNINLALGQVYTWVAAPTETEIAPGLRKFKFYNSTTGKNEYYEFVKWTGEYPTEPSYLFIIIEAGNEGNDKIEKNYTQIGNQMAYELLGMGYTILYKKINYVDSKWDLDDLKDEEYWSALTDKSTYDFRYITLAGYNDIEAQKQIAAIARFDETAKVGRGDCVALLDINDLIFNAEKTQLNAAKKIEIYAATFGALANKYTAFFAPTITYTTGSFIELAKFDYNTTFPASFHYLACASKAAESYKEWFAVAGYTRGVSDYAIAGIGYKFGDIAATYLAPRTVEIDGFKCVNLIITEKKNYYIWGNRTAEALTKADGLKASHFLNIRQLCSTLKKKLYVVCRQKSFDPNSDLLWVSFCNAIRPTLDDMKANEGITDYEILKKVTREKAKLTAIIRIVPIEAVEDFDISVYLEDSLSGALDVNTIEG